MLAPLLTAIALLAGPSAQAQVDLSLEPATSSAQVGEVIEIRLVATAQDDIPAHIGALDAILAYDPVVLELLGHDATDADYAWFVAGFLQDPDGINLDISDGDALFTALAQLEVPATAPPPPGLHVTTLRFLALAPSAATQVQFLPTLGSFGMTQVLDFYVPGSNITGDIASTATVTVGGMTAYCAGSNAACPCDNAAGPGEGCANSSGAGALLVGSGSTSISTDDLVLVSSNLPPGLPTLLFHGDDAVNGGQGILFGDGLRCAGVNVRRLGILLPDGNGVASWGAGLAAANGWQGGEVYYFQSWYRDPAGPCGSGFNLSHGLEVVFTP